MNIWGLIRKIITSAIASGLVISAALTVSQEASLSANSAGSKITHENIAFTHYLLGVKYDSKYNFNSALEEYSEAIKLNSAYTEAYFKRGVIYTKMVMYNEALKDLNKVIELNPKSAEAYTHRGIVYFLLHNVDKSTADNQYALALDSISESSL